MRHEKTTDPFYSSGAWRTARKERLKKDGLHCVWCKRAGRWTTDRHGRTIRVPATMVHHIKPYQTHPELALDLDNLVSLCDSCHDAAHPEKLGRAKKEPPLAVRMGIRVEDIRI